MNLKHRPIPKTAIKEMQESGVHINLLLTRRCNFECSHCMMAAGPKMPAAYMDWKDLEHIHGFIRHLQEEHEINTVDVNLVGGEPTLDMEQFDTVLDIVTRWPNVSLEMTTNGWWLREWTTVKKFVNAVWRPLADETLGHIRISDSPFHDPFRGQEKRWIKENLVADVLRSPWDYELRTDVCPHCEAESSLNYRDDDFECNVCGKTTPEDEIHYNRDLGYPSGIDTIVAALEEGRIYVDHQSGCGNKISPVGRARNSQEVDAWQDGYCSKSQDIHFTFMPSGALYDACCNGGKVALGHATDPEQLFRARYHFMKALHEKYPSEQNAGHNSLNGKRCHACPSFGAKWLKAKSTPEKLKIAV